jgi:hypothetical protein
MCDRIDQWKKHGEHGTVPSAKGTTVYASQGEERSKMVSPSVYEWRAANFVEWNRTYQIGNEK